MFKKTCILAAITCVSLFGSSTANADFQIDKVVYLASVSPAVIGQPPVSKSGVNVTGTVDFKPTFVNFWLHNGTNWVFAAGSNLSSEYSATDSRLYNKTVYRFFATGIASGAFSPRVIDIDLFNPATNSWVKMSTTKGFVYPSGNNIIKPSF
jgi:hypothetical protein